MTKLEEKLKYKIGKLYKRLLIVKRCKILSLSLVISFCYSLIFTLEGITEGPLIKDYLYLGSYNSTQILGAFAILSPIITIILSGLNNKKSTKLIKTVIVLEVIAVLITVSYFYSKHIYILTLMIFMSLVGVIYYTNREKINIELAKVFKRTTLNSRNQLSMVIGSIAGIIGGILATLYDNNILVSIILIANIILVIVYINYYKEFKKLIGEK